CLLGGAGRWPLHHASHGPLLATIPPLAKSDAWLRQGVDFAFSPAKGGDTPPPPPSTVPLPRCAGEDQLSPIFSAWMKASWGISTLPNWRMRFLPSFCFSRSL